MRAAAAWLLFRVQGVVVPPRYAPGGDIKVTKSYDGIHWAAPRTLYTQRQHGGIPKVRVREGVAASAPSCL